MSDIKAKVEIILTSHVEVQLNNFLFVCFTNGCVLKPLVSTDVRLHLSDYTGAGCLVPDVKKHFGMKAASQGN